MQQGLCVLS